eukprot:UN33452
MHEAHVEGARLLVDVVQKNSGLYIKCGQLLGQMVHLIPAEYIDALKHLFDKAPERTYESVRKTFKEELGSYPEDIFENFNPNPVASASLAQVYVGYLEDKKSNKNKKLQ